MPELYFIASFKSWINPRSKEKGDCNKGESILSGISRLSKLTPSYSSVSFSLDLLSGYTVNWDMISPIEVKINIWEEVWQNMNKKNLCWGFKQNWLKILHQIETD